MTAVRKLLRHDADINATKDGMTTLLYAARYGNVDFVRELIKEGAKVDLPGTLPIFLVAAQAGRQTVLLNLLQNWLQYSQQGPKQVTSIRSRRFRHVRKAVMSNLNPWVPDQAGRTPLYAAAEAKQ